MGCGWSGGGKWDVVEGVGDIEVEKLVTELNWVMWILSTCEDSDAYPRAIGDDGDVCGRLDSSGAGLAFL